MKHLIAVVTILTLAACTQAPPPAPDTREAEAKTIKGLEAAWVKDIASRDVAKSFSYYASDASVLVPGMPVMTGADSIQAGLKEFLADPNLGVAFESTKVTVSKSGDLAYSQGTSTFTMTDPKTKKPVTEKGKYVFVWAKQADGSWKVVADIGNPDGPPTPAAK
jgi:uncharacterized protein (TIGR02246 family)